MLNINEVRRIVVKVGKMCIRDRLPIYKHFG